MGSWLFHRFLSSFRGHRSYWKLKYIQEFTSHFCLRDSGHQLISNLEGVNLAAVDRLQHAGHTEDPRRVLEQAGSGFEDFVDVVIPCDIGFREPPAHLRI